MTETRQVILPADLCAVAEQRYQGKFGTLEELLTCVLRELVRDDAFQADEAEQRIVEQRLRELGYL
jgi:hypothetical protein